MGPITLVLTFNMFLFVFILIVIVCHTAHRLKGTRKAVKWRHTAKTMLGLTGVMVLFGVTWIFGFFTILGAAPYFRFLFAIFNSLQGFFIFLFFVVLSKEVRELWIAALCHRKKKYRLPGTASPNFHSSTGGGLTRQSSISKSEDKAAYIELSSSSDLKKMASVSVSVLKLIPSGIFGELKGGSLIIGSSLFTIGCRAASIYRLCSPPSFSSSFFSHCRRTME